MFNIEEFHTVTEIIQADFDGGAVGELEQDEPRDFGDYIVAVIGGQTAFFLPDESPYAMHEADQWDGDPLCPICGYETDAGHCIVCRPRDEIERSISATTPH